MTAQDYLICYYLLIFYCFGLLQVVTREAIYCGLADCSFKASLVNWALPFAQRYIFSLHPDKYLKLKQSGFDTLNYLKVVVVDKLFYRNVIKSNGGASKKRFECSCLLQVSTDPFVNIIFFLLQIISF